MDHSLVCTRAWPQWARGYLDLEPGNLGNLPDGWAVTPEIRGVNNSLPPPPTPTVTTLHSSNQQPNIVFTFLNVYSSYACRPR